MSAATFFEYHGRLYPDIIRKGNACRFIAPTALEFCKGRGVDVGAGKWPLPGAVPVEVTDGGDAMDLGERDLDFVFSSHCLEHLADPIAALRHWRDCLIQGGVLFLYLPSPEMEYWLPENLAKHRHSWTPERMAAIVEAVGFKRVLHSQRDLAYGYSVVGWKGGI